MFSGSSPAFQYVLAASCTEECALSSQGAEEEPGEEPGEGPEEELKEEPGEGPGRTLGRDLGRAGEDPGCDQFQF